MKKANELCKELRNRSGLSMNQLSKELGVSPTMVSYIERGMAPINKDIAERYALLFGEQYLDPLTEDLVRFIVDPVALDNIMKTKGIKVVDAAKAFGVRHGSFDILLRPKENYYKALSNHEVEDLAFYLGVPISKLNPKRTIISRTPSKHTELKLQKKEEASVAVNKFSYTVDKSGCVKATAVSTSDELKAQLKKYSEYCDAKDKENSELKAKLAEMDRLKANLEETTEAYERCVKKAKEYDILEAKYKESQDHVESLTKQTDDAIKEMLRVNDVCSKLREKVNNLEKINKELVAEVKKCDQMAVDFKDLKDLQATKEKLTYYKDLLLEVLLERRQKTS